MPEQDQNNDILESSFQRGLQFLDHPVTERLATLEEPAKDYLANFSLLDLPLDFNGIKHFFECSGLVLSDDEYLAWLVTCLEMNLFLKMEGDESQVILWKTDNDVYAYFLAHSKIEDLKRYHRNADRFFLKELASLAKSINIALPDESSLREKMIGPHGFLYHISHLPQYQNLHQTILNLAIIWFDHLFWLEEYKEAADILNAVCFALARRGQQKMAQNMLASIASKTKGLTAIVAQINLATLLRSEQQLTIAMRLYWQTIPPLLRQHAYIQLAQVLSEMAAIYRQMGKRVKSALLLEFSVMLNRWLKNGKSKAIAHSQLSTTYRHLKLYSLALKNSKRAVDYFRATNDLLNLGRSLLTQGNIHYNNSRNELALQCFTEALEIGQQIADPQAKIGAVSGKARIFLSLKQYDEAQTLLYQAIGLRREHNDHNIGIEYQNMGVLHEQKGEFAKALSWYKKALVEFEKYIPGEAPACRKSIALMQKKLE